MSTKPITVEDVRASINYNVPMIWTVRWFGRPLANLITPAFYNSGWTADQVTYFRALIGAAGFLVLVVPGYWPAPIAAAAFYTCFVFDCVDGNLARLHESTSYWGKFIDGLADFLFILGAPFAAGLGLMLSGESPYWLAIGAATAIASLTSQMVRNRLSFTREWMVNQSGPLQEAEIRRCRGTKLVQATVAGIYVNGTFVAPLLLVLPDWGRKFYLLALIPVQLLCEIVWTVASISEARILLDRKRRSIHAAVSETR